MPLKESADPVVFITFRDMIGKIFKWIDGVPHGYARSGVLDHFKIIILVTEGNDAVLWNSEARGHFFDADGFIQAGFDDFDDVSRSSPAAMIDQFCMDVIEVGTDFRNIVFISMDQHGSGVIFQYLAYISGRDGRIPHHEYIDDLFIMIVKVHIILHFRHDILEFKTVTGINDLFGCLKVHRFMMDSPGRVTRVMDECSVEVDDRRIEPHLLIVKFTRTEWSACCNHDLMPIFPGFIEGLQRAHGYFLFFCKQGSVQVKDDKMFIFHVH